MEQEPKNPESSKDVPNFSLDARTPEQIADVENRREEVRRIVDGVLQDIKDKTLREFEATGSIKGSLQDALREATNLVNHWERPTESHSEKLIRDQDLQHVISLLKTHYKIDKPTRENITSQILKHIADKTDLVISDWDIEERLLKEVLELNY